MLMIGKALTAGQRLMKSTIDILSRDEFVALSGVLMVLQQSIESKDVARPTTKTAMTNGLKITYAEEFVDSLTDAELRFLVLHEAFHCMYQHLTTWEWMYREDAALGNSACDYVINIQLCDLADKMYETDCGAVGSRAERFITMPKGGLCDAKYRDMDSGAVYALLKKEQEEQEQEDEQDDEQGGESSGDSGAGNPGPGDGDGEEEGDEPGDGAGAPGDKPANKQSRGEGKPQGFDDHDWEGAAAMPDAEKADAARAMEEAMRQGALLAGKLGTGGERLVGDLLAAKVRWQDALREYLYTVCAGNDYSTWRKPNRRYIASGIYMPSGVSETMDEIVIAVDTSGSIGGPELSQFLGEINAICQTISPEVVRLLYWDTQVARSERYEKDQLANIAQSTKPAGGGGTAPSCVTRYLAESNIKPQVVVMLTDGYVGADWGGQWPCPVVWCIVGNKSAVPATGQAIHVEWTR